MKLDRTPADKVDKGETSNLKFLINSVSSDMLYQKKMWDARKLQQFEMMEQGVNQIVFLIVYLEQITTFRLNYQ